MFRINHLIDQGTVDHVFIFLADLPVVPTMSILNHSGTIKGNEYVEKFW